LLDDLAAESAGRTGCEAPDDVALEIKEGGDRDEHYEESGCAPSLVLCRDDARPEVCRSYRVVARISSADDSDQGGQPIARCTLRGTLANESR
jgi:hypothetical protein